MCLCVLEMLELVCARCFVIFWLGSRCLLYFVLCARCLLYFDALEMLQSWYFLKEMKINNLVASARLVHSCLLLVGCCIVACCIVVNC